MIRLIDIDQDIIEINDDENIKFLSQELVNVVLKTYESIA